MADPPNGASEEPSDVWNSPDSFSITQAGLGKQDRCDICFRFISV